MRHKDVADRLLGVFNPHSLRLILLLYDRPHTRTQIYDVFRSANNVHIREAITQLQNMGVIHNDLGRGSPVRLTVKGITVAEWLLEGVMIYGD